jgi:Domain of unknown function (DUF6487)
MNLTAIRSSPIRSLPDPSSCVICHECGSPMTKGILLQNNIWVTPIPAARSVARRLEMWMMGGLYHKHKVNAWRCPHCARIELIAK